MFCSFLHGPDCCDAAAAVARTCCWAVCCALAAKCQALPKWYNLLHNWWNAFFSSGDLDGSQSVMAWGNILKAPKRKALKDAGHYLSWELVLTITSFYVGTSLYIYIHISIEFFLIDIDVDFEWQILTQCITIGDVVSLILRCQCKKGEKLSTKNNEGSVIMPPDWVFQSSGRFWKLLNGFLWSRLLLANRTSVKLQVESIEDSTEPRPCLVEWKLWHHHEFLKFTQKSTGSFCKGILSRWANFFGKGIL